MNVEVLYEGVLIGQGPIRMIEQNHAIVTIQNIPLNANSFLDLIMRSMDYTRVIIPVRVQRNSGDGLEVELENIDPEILETLFRNKY